MRFDVFEYTNKGGRDHNEDSLGADIREDGGIFVVADGLGGHILGERASGSAVETILSGWRARGKADTAEIPDILTELIAKANEGILALREETHTVMKTTVALLAVTETSAHWANVGDSRVYFIHDSRIHSFTNDHSVAFKKYKGGEITREQIATDEDQSSLLRSLGGTDRNLPELYTSDVGISAGDAFLLCSDGAWEYLRDEEILIDCLKAATAAQWGELLLLRIMERVGADSDNLSVLTVKIV